ncbi:putative K+ potassium transporter [Lyophyllum shimeji]|uniref:K+ potassium transporter n=1 Tax=Lyophyllum shimeji TaxID=47721 RepID=A0A9P3PMV9_LYOSH|nr:putative K+ potassium transporter [Lyophyllum shimeji]
MSSPETSEEKGINLNAKREAVDLRGLPLLSLSFQALGIIYSDIGTSPLYVLNGIWPPDHPPPPREDVIGSVSAIIWSLTLLPLLKYVFISLRFGTTEGEGGSFALYQGLFPPVAKDCDADRTLTGDSTSLDETLAERSGGRRITHKVRWPMLIWCLMGTALTMADGVFTPAVSVTSAVGGIGVAKPSILNKVSGIAIAFLAALFLVQRFGTGRIAWTYGPISFIWFLLLAGTGIYNITFHPAIFRAFDPSRAVLLFVRTRNYDILAGVLLAITGCEAIFANLGQFNQLSIQLSFTTLVYPSLVLAYLGQGARLVHDGNAVISSVFYKTIPGRTDGPLFWIMFIFAILATIIASQAMITATFSLVQQLINFKSFPPIRMVHTSEVIQGQVYIPAINWALMIGTIVVVAAFTNVANLTNAYGFAVATVMFSTTVLIAVHIYYVKGLPPILGVGYFLIFGFFDALFWGAALKKVPHGAWVPLMIGICLLSLMLLWTWAKSLEDNFDRKNRKNLRQFIQQEAYRLDQDKDDNAEGAEDDSSSSESNLTYYYMPGVGERTDTGEVVRRERKKLQRIPTVAVFLKMTHGKGVPHTFIGFIRQWPALPRVVIFLSVCIVPVARVPKEDRYAVTKVRTIDGFYGVTYYLGFRDRFDVQIHDLIEKICDMERAFNPNGSAAVIDRIRAVAQIAATHIAPHYHVVSKEVTAGPRPVSVTVNWMRRYLIESIYRRLATMFPETGNWLTSAEEIIQVGIHAVI